MRWAGQGFEYEADPRKAEKLIKDTELQGANAVTTPGTKPLPHHLEQEQPLSMPDFTRFRGQAARANTWGMIGQTSSTRPRKFLDACRR